ncbi:MAG: hypothetical protein OK438_07975 [Thaumarchaeota archaeon]|nr:hypothetical protein [Nitrososphaerota archaeon]
MKFWVPLALGSVIIVGYAFFYMISNLGAPGAGTFGLVNSVGLAAVLLGIVAAGVILRRATPPQ